MKPSVLTGGRRLLRPEGIHYSKPATRFFFKATNGHVTSGDRKKCSKDMLSPQSVWLRGSPTRFTEAIKTPNEHELRLQIRFISKIHTSSRRGIRLAPACPNKEQTKF